MKAKFKISALLLISLLFIFSAIFIVKKSNEFKVYQINLYSDDFELENYQIIKTTSSYYIPDTYSIKALNDYKLISDVSFSVKHKNEYLTTSNFNFPNENIIYSKTESINNNYSINDNNELIFTFKYKKNDELKEITHSVKLNQYKKNY